MSLRISLLLTTAVLILSAFFLATPAHAAGVCDIYSASTGAPTGYGASYNVFKTSEMMVSIACNEDKSIKVTAGNNDPLTYLYKDGYYYNPSAKSWTKFSYSCDNMIVNSWCVGQVNKTLTDVPTDANNFLVSFTCQWSGSKWNCGCSNTSCSTAKWQIQGWRVAQSGGGGSDGGGSSGGDGGGPATGDGTYDGPAKLIFSDDFENGFGDIKAHEPAYTGDRGSDLKQECAGGVRKYLVVDNPSGQSGHALRLTQAGDGSCLAAYDPKKTKHRAEVRALSPNGGDLDVGDTKGEKWIGYSLFVPSSGDWRGADPVSHFTLTKADSVLSLEKGDSNSIDLNVRNRLCHDQQGEKAIELAYNQWHDLVIRIVHTSDKSGRIEVWHNGTKKVTLTGPTMCDGRGSHYAGIYWGTLNRSVRHQLYMDNWRVAEGPDGYDLVNPANY